ncbi:MAG: ATP synthase F1 subunit gamma [Solobacterium sp.]|nr:ATP synthase F1 subunit gamma [Solobacterium sp.]
MQSMQSLRSRIRSVNSTRKITNAMEMIANAKLFKQRNAMEANREYAARLRETVNEIVVRNPGIESPYLVRNDNPGKLTIVFCSDMGLCGAYNMNILRHVRNTLSKTDDPIILYGTSLHHTLMEEGYRLLNEEPIPSDKVTAPSIRDSVQAAMNLFLSGEVGTLQVIRTRFVNTMSFHPETVVLLPCEMDTELKQDGPYVETLFEPNAETILAEIMPMMISDMVYSSWMEATTSEQGSRRMAMKTATDNADELSEELLLEYNKARQAAITQEITEIVGGSEAV